MLSPNISALFISVGAGGAPPRFLFFCGANKDMDNLLGALAPRLLVPVLLDRARIPGGKKAHDLTKQERI